jgi:addiction module RelE/StbE family toxin
MFKIEYLDSVVKKDIPALPSKIRQIIKKAIEERLIVDPISFGKPLRYSLKGHKRLRVGDYRIIYRIEFTSKKVLIVAIKHRKNVYEN